MTRRPPNFFLFLLLVCTLVGSSGSAGAQGQTKWRLKSRLQTVYEYDSNVAEAAAGAGDQTGDSSFRLSFETSASRSGKRSRLGFNYKGGLQTYRGQASDNKLINELSGQAVTRIHSFQLGIRGSGRLKLYLNQNLDYSTGSVEAFVRPPVILGFGSELSAQRSGLDYQTFSDFDYTTWQLRWDLSRRLSRRLNWQTSLSARRISYTRSRLELLPGQDGIVFIGRQRDNSRQFRTTLSYSRGFLWNIGYLFERNNSNSAGFTFSRHQASLFFAAKLAHRIWLRGYAAVEVKRYRESDLVLPVDADPERNESSFFILDISRDLNAQITALLRFAYYDNESVIRDRFYRKTLLTVGFDFRF